MPRFGVYSIKLSETGICVRELKRALQMDLRTTTIGTTREKRGYFWCNKASVLLAQNRKRVRVEWRVNKAMWEESRCLR